MRGYENDRPAMFLLGAADDNGHIGTSGRQIKPMVGPDDETTRERLHTPRARQIEPRALDDIFRR